MKRNARTAAIIVLAGVFSVGPNAVLAQGRLYISNESTLVVDGTSNQSDWSVTADSLNGWLEFSEYDGGEMAVAGLELSIPVAEMKGGKSPIMDRLMSRTLKANEHRHITYVLSAPATPTAGISTTGIFSLETVGDLTIAGVTNSITMTVDGRRGDDGKLVFSGSHEMKMSEFGMKPPTALFGALHTRDDIVVKFEIRVEGS